MSKLGHISGIVDGNYNNPKFLQSDYRWCYHWCILCGVCLEDTDNGVRKSKVCYKCLGNITKVSIDMSKIKTKIITLDEQRLQSHLDNHPDDIDTRKILADILEEEGREDECKCQRWLIKHHKWPDNKLKVFNLSGWHWWSCADGIHKERLHAVILDDMQLHMPKGEWLYSSRIEAEEVLALALVAYYGSKQHA